VKLLNLLWNIKEWDGKPTDPDGEWIPIKAKARNDAKFWLKLNFNRWLYVEEDFSLDFEKEHQGWSRYDTVRKGFNKRREEIKDKKKMPH